MNRRELIIGGLYVAAGPPSLGDLAKMGNPTQTGRSLMWRRLTGGLSFEQAQFNQSDDETSMSGTALIAEDGQPLRVKYEIRCDRQSRTRSAFIESEWGGVRCSLRLEHDSSGSWLCDGLADNALAGCTDLDLAITPSTNALPIRRLGLTAGQRQEITVAWIRFPFLQVSPVMQSYRRIDEDQYEFKSLATNFSAVLRVDRDGLPIRYGNVWDRIAEGPSVPDTLANRFADALLSFGPAADLGSAVNDFGWLIGGWSAKVIDYDEDGTMRHGEGEWWFSWVLEGRAIQDVWISPPRSQRSPRQAGPPKAAMSDNRYGTTIRWFDAQHKSRIVWVNPVSGVTNTLEGQRAGDTIVLLGAIEGSPIRWSFNSIRKDSFVWKGEEQKDGKWTLGSEFRLTRTA